MVSKVCKTIHNKYVNPSLIERAIKSLEELEIYSDWISFKSPGSDSLAISLTRDGKPLTISMEESKDMDFEIRGDEDVVDIFIKEMTAEVASIAAVELCGCLSETDNEELRNQFRQSILGAIEVSIFLS